MTRRHAYAALLLLAFDAAFLAPALFTSDVRAPADVTRHWPPFLVDQASPPPPPHNELLNDWLAQFHPWHHLVRDAWLAGKPPLWNDAAGCGEPLLANTQCEALSPFLPLLLFTGDQYVDWRQLAQMFLAQIFCLLLAHELGLSVAAGAVVALAYSFASFMQVWAIHPHAASASFAPGILWALLRLCARVSAARILVASLCVAGSILAGHPETAAKGALVGGVIAAAHGLLKWPAVGRRRFGLGIVAVAAFGVLLAAAMIAPFLEYVAHSDVRHVRDIVPPEPMPLGQLVTLLYPNALGSPLTPPTYHGVANYPDAVLHVGIAALVLAAWGAAWGCVRRPSLTAPLLAVIAVSIAVSSAIIPTEAWRKIPIISDIRPFRYLSCAILPLALLAGIGFDGGARLLGRAAGRWRIATGGAVVAAVALTSAWPWHCFLVATPVNALHPKSRALETLSERSRAGGRTVPLGRVIEPGFAETYGFRSLVRFDAIGVERYREYFDVAPAGFALFNDRKFTFGPWALLDAASVRWVLATYLSRDTRAPLRPVTAHAGAPVTFSASAVLDRSRGLDVVVFRWLPQSVEDGTIDVVVVHGATETRYTAGRGAPSPRAPGLREFIDVHLRPFASQVMTIPPDVWRRADHLRFEVRDGGAPFMATALFPGGVGDAIAPVAAFDWVFVDERATAMPDAYLTPRIKACATTAEASESVHSAAFDPRAGTAIEVFEPGGSEDSPLRPEETAALVRREPGRLEIAVTAARDRWLVVTDTFMPGWKATVDGADVPVVPANVLFRACRVPAGTHTVVMRYAPWTFTAGWVTSLVTLGALLFAALRGESRRAIASDTSPTTPRA